MKSPLSLRTLLLLAAVALSGCAELGMPAAGPSGPPRGVGTVIGRQGAATASVTITVEEARGLAVRHGLTGYRSLPPGIQRNLARGKRLPPGLERRGVPGGMLDQLPRVDGHEWRVAGRDLILVAIGTLIVVEILDDVFS
jgi:hypothetical protein